MARPLAAIALLASIVSSKPLAFPQPNTDVALTARQEAVPSSVSGNETTAAGSDAPEITNLQQAQVGAATIDENYEPTSCEVRTTIPPATQTYDGKCIRACLKLFERFATQWNNHSPPVVWGLS